MFEIPGTGYNVQKGFALIWLGAIGKKADGKTVEKIQRFGNEDTHYV